MLHHTSLSHTHTHPVNKETQQHLQLSSSYKEVSEETLVDCFMEKQLKENKVVARRIETGRYCVPDIYVHMEGGSRIGFCFGQHKRSLCDRVFRSRNSVWNWY